MKKNEREMIWFQTNPSMVESGKDRGTLPSSRLCSHPSPGPRPPGILLGTLPVRRPELTSQPTSPRVSSTCKHLEIPEPIKGFALVLVSFALVGLGLSLVLHIAMPLLVSR